MTDPKRSSESVGNPWTKINGIYTQYDECEHTVFIDEFERFESFTSVGGGGLYGIAKNTGALVVISGENAELLLKLEQNFKDNWNSFAEQLIEHGKH